MTQPIPYVLGAVRARLMADSVFAAACEQRCAIRAPDDVSIPYCRLRTAGGPAIEASAGMWLPLVQVEGWCSAAGWAGRPAEEVAWDIAAHAARVLAVARNVAYQHMRYSARITDGPLADEDTKRGESAPLYRALIRAELKIHHQ